MIITSQTKTAEDFELLPDPERIVNGLRDTGYNFNTAIADIVDNSIAANATKVNIDVDMDPNMNIRVYIADNGCGMDLDGLKNAMKWDYSAVGIRRISAVGISTSAKSSVNTAFSPSTM